jgi:thiamine biosynthesis lipoprotein
MVTERLTRRRAIGLLRRRRWPAPRRPRLAVDRRGRHLARPRLGVPATLILHHPDRVAAERLLTRAALEVARLESIFSLNRADSALSELNRTGALAVPTPELVAILDECRRFHARTDGAFDPTIPPLWRLYATHFAAGGDPTGPPAAALAEARARVGLDAVRANRARIAFTRPGMALTLNGIAEGWITDRIVDLMREAGVTSSLVDMGEIRALGDNDGRPWQVAIAGAGTVLPLTDRAAATSSPDGFHFDGAGRFSHIIDPRSGATPRRYARVTVTAPAAATADALSTGLMLLDPRSVSRALQPDAIADIDEVA